MQPALRSSLLGLCVSVSLAAASAAGGCNATITSDGCEDSCDEGGGGSGAGGNGGGIVSDTGVAIRYGDMYDDGGPDDGGSVVATTGSGVSTGPSPVTDPETLMLIFGSEAVACASPGGLDEACPPAEWKVTIPLSVARQQPGTYLLSDLVNEGAAGGPWMEEQGQNIDADDCWWGAGTFYGGTIQVLSVDDASITFDLQGSDRPEADGQRTVPRCGSAPPPPAHAIALTEAQLNAIEPTDPPDTSVSVTTGGEPPPSDRLFIFIDESPSAAGISCSDPYAYESTCVVERKILVVSLTEDALFPGIYSMTDPRIGVSLSESGPADQGGCWGSGGGGGDGTVEVLSVDDEHVAIRVDGGPVTSVEAVASRCP